MDGWRGTVSTLVRGYLVLLLANSILCIAMDSTMHDNMHTSLEYARSMHNLSTVCTRVSMASHITYDVHVSMASHINYDVHGPTDQ